MVWRTAAVVMLSIALTGPVGAVSGVAPTNLTIHVKDGLVYGMLAGPPVCRPGRTVDLVVNGLGVTSTTTDGHGRYSFTYEPSAGAQIRTEFDGAIMGVHPDTIVCHASVSRTIVAGRVPPKAGGREGNGVAAVPPGGAFKGVETATAAAVALAAAAVGTSLLVLEATWTDPGGAAPPS